MYHEISLQAMKQIKKMKLVEMAYINKEAALDRLQKLISTVEQSESNRQVRA